MDRKAQIKAYLGGIELEAIRGLEEGCGPFLEGILEGILWKAKKIGQSIWEKEVE